MSTRQSKPRSLSPKCCQMHKTENYTQVQIWCKKVHFTFHQILTNCIFLSETRHVWYPAAGWCIGAPKKRSIVFHFTALTTWTSLCSMQCSLVQWLVPFWCWCTVEWKGRGRLLVWNSQALPRSEHTLPGTGSTSAAWHSSARVWSHFTKPALLSAPDFLRNK